MNRENHEKIYIRSHLSCRIYGKIDKLLDLLGYFIANNFLRLLIFSFLLIILGGMLR